MGVGQETKWWWLVILTSVDGRIILENKQQAYTKDQAVQNAYDELPETTYTYEAHMHTTVFCGKTEPILYH